MVTQNRGKYLWENIKAGPPKISYEFEKGITINGKVEREQKPNSKNKISLFSLKTNLFDETFIDQNNDFKFEHFFVQDSTVLGLQMSNEKNNTLTTKIEARIARNEPRFALGPSFEKTFCPIKKVPENVFNFPPPKIKATTLKEVEVKNTPQKEVFIHKSDVSFMARAFKIDGKSHQTLLNFLSSNGYNTGIDPSTNTVRIADRRDAYKGWAPGSYLTATPPNVYIDNFLLYDFNDLYYLTLDQIDEIYIDRTGSSDVTALRGHGTIKIFMKTGQKNEYFKVKHTSLIVTKGFAQNFTYKTVPLEDQVEFNYFGTLNWSPNVELTDHSDFQIKIPKNGQKEITVLIEGFTNDGYLISEVRKIPIGVNN
ncbi:hypothetical protein ACQ9BO_07230 [Flavobacterium sp. P21]|uniref:hypothetical protein n=1 Tax=Flavobacterium sp. P21 TaxID=3423948 RepID=UPI003D67E55A